jgi:hypothetical protein
MTYLTLPVALLLSFLLSHAALADPARVVGIDATPAASGWTFSVTLEHGDTGWEDYADGWRVEAPDGTILGERPLAHPHVTEQPFTRSVSGVAIPGDLTEVVIRARTNVEGWAEETSGPVTLAR